MGTLKVAGATVGLGQLLKNNTPNVLKTISRIVLYLSGLWAILAPMLSNVPPETQNLIDHWLLIGNTLLRFTFQFFGFDYDTTSNFSKPAASGDIELQNK